MFQSSGIEVVVLCAALQIGGGLLGAFQGVMKAQIARVGLQARRAGHPAPANLLARTGQTLVGLLAGLLAALTLLGLVGWSVPVVSTLLIANTVLPILGSLLFVLPAWWFCASFFVRMVLPVDVTAQLES